MNANPQNKALPRRVADKLAAQKAGKSLRIVVPGKCRVCNRRSADVPATKGQVEAWLLTRSTDGFLKYEVRMLLEGLHRDCQKVADRRAKGEKVPAPPREGIKIDPAVQACIDVAEKAHQRKIMARRALRKQQGAAPAQSA
jgi:hypothetical protein